MKSGDSLTSSEGESMLTTRSLTRRTALVLLPLACSLTGTASLAAEDDSKQARAARDPLVLTATNGATNYLAVVNARTKEINYVPTGGVGNVAGNAGGVAVSGRMAAVVNFGSSTVTIF